jgi:hypothetical protein
MREGACDQLHAGAPYGEQTMDASPPRPLRLHVPLGSVAHWAPPHCELEVHGTAQ